MKPVNLLDTFSATHPAAIKYRYPTLEELYAAQDDTHDFRFDPQWRQKRAAKIAQQGKPEENK